MDLDELEHKRRLLAMHRRRLEELEVRAAALGLNTPPEVAIEIGDIGVWIKRLQNELASHLQKQASVAGANMPAPILDESRQFATLTTFDQKKDLLIHPFEQAIQYDRRRLSQHEMTECAASPWEFDRIALYLYEEHRLAASLESRTLHVRQEVEKHNAHGGQGSLIPLHYAIRSVLTLLSKDDHVAAAKRSIEIFTETLDYLRSHPDIDKSGQVKRNLRKILTILDGSNS